jgi:MFS transporter, ACS family, solute carrier family 17 (sodium-dependent inorganic phosphate cotransporter), other
MGFLAIVNAYTMRICLNVAITEMVVKLPLNGTDDPNKQFCTVEGGESADSLGGGEYMWSETLQGVILGAFFWG